MSQRHALVLYLSPTKAGRAKAAPEGINGAEEGGERYARQNGKAHKCLWVRGETRQGILAIPVCMPRSECGFGHADFPLRRSAAGRINRHTRRYSAAADTSGCVDRAQLATILLRLLML